MDPGDVSGCGGGAGTFLDVRVRGSLSPVSQQPSKLHGPRAAVSRPREIEGQHYAGDRRARGYAARHVEGNDTTPDLRRVCPAHEEIRAGAVAQTAGRALVERVVLARPQSDRVRGRRTGR